MTSRPTLLVVLISLAALAVGTAATPLWDEDEARFAAIARTMVETGDWIVPRFNGTLAVDKPVLMHWCMAACMSVFGINEFAARLPSMFATLATALALLRAGRRWCDDTTGIVAALAYVGCLLVAIESHAATPDAILTALTAWATILLAEGIMPGADGMLRRPSLASSVIAGLLLGLAVVCKGPIGFVGPMAVLGPWAWWLAAERRAAPVSRDATTPWMSRMLRAAVPSAIEATVALRPVVVLLATLAAAAPWYVAVTLQTDGAWTSGFFYVHNVGRFMAPMEQHSGNAAYHPLVMLVGFYPWSCFLPFALVVAIWRLVRHTVSGTTAHALHLTVAWLAVWVGGFSAAATKLPNYVLPAYPAAALLMAIMAVDAVHRAARSGHWIHPRWMAAGLGWLIFGGVATAATIVIGARYGLPGAEPAAIVGLVPVIGAVVCGVEARRRPATALAAFTATGIVYAALAVGPAQQRIAVANTLPSLVRTVEALPDTTAPIGTYLLASPNIVFYADRPVTQIGDGDIDGITRFLTSDADAVLLVPEDHYESIARALPPGCGVVNRARPVFRQHDIVAVGRLSAPHRTATIDEETRR